MKNLLKTFIWLNILKTLSINISIDTLTDHEQFDTVNYSNYEDFNQHKNSLFFHDVIFFRFESDYYYFTPSENSLLYIWRYDIKKWTTQRVTERDYLFYKETGSEQFLEFFIKSLDKPCIQLAFSPALFYDKYNRIVGCKFDEYGELVAIKEDDDKAIKVVTNEVKKVYQPDNISLSSYLTFYKPKFIDWPKNIKHGDTVLNEFDCTSYESNVYNKTYNGLIYFVYRGSFYFYYYQKHSLLYKYIYDDSINSYRWDTENEINYVSCKNNVLKFKNSFHSNKLFPLNEIKFFIDDENDINRQNKIYYDLEEDYTYSTNLKDCNDYNRYIEKNELNYISFKSVNDNVKYLIYKYVYGDEQELLTYQTINDNKGYFLDLRYNKRIDGKCITKSNGSMLYFTSIPNTSLVIGSSSHDGIEKFKLRDLQFLFYNENEYLK